MIARILIGAITLLDGPSERTELMRVLGAAGGATLTDAARRVVLDRDHALENAEDAVAEARKLREDLAMERERGMAVARTLQAIEAERSALRAELEGTRAWLEVLRIAGKQET